MQPAQGKNDQISSKSEQIKNLAPRTSPRTKVDFVDWMKLVISIERGVVFLS